ncbi:MAG: D-aminoacyl-tRNA deacylase [Spirochaetota bacterium]|jgi:D-tyrosyl-tRNA(Tyr) deacylase|nr:D-aminoacyl-tRNA deacylase [Spirochaetota bacterium]OPZ38793.1 MAG: D-tyrosyl-tRNA(Tyr) deacylase [Spirochaetes bacterium ADurb.BinA120]HPI15046.1 D-aminoacyl-tRNA deacylase [Spirochaetota bacterium]HPV98518.1 D-aminoacyl-tRNA deacylase [Spirochaetota bacterium]
MRAVVQRVLKAGVECDGSAVASIDRGMLALVGFHRDDTDADSEYITGKLLGLRIFDDAAGVMNLNLSEAGGGLLLVSQFTLYGDARKGRRPSYSEAMAPGPAREMFDRFTARCRELHPVVERGLFGAEMMVSLVNWGPVTILLDSARLF